MARFAGRPLQGSGYGYGLVVEHDEVRGRTVGHAGGLPGFASHMRWQASSRIGVVAFGSSDEFPAWRVTAAALESVGAATTPRPGEIWPETLAAAERLDAIVRAGAPIAAAENLFSTNVLRDVPGTVRDRRIRELVERVRAPVAAPAPRRAHTRSLRTTRAALWVVATERGALRCSAPHGPCQPGGAVVLDHRRRRGLTSSVPVPRASSCDEADAHPSSSARVPHPTQ
ncbi:MAG: hypothetical protein R2692_02165 [Microbacterium sp.]